MKASHQWNQIWSNTTVDCLAKLGVQYACISPGSRNSALTQAFASHPSITSFSHIDERSGGFFALGLANASQTPVVLVCTSGTAVANFMPAVIEASLSRIPLIILSADRPEFLINTGANQTIQQKHLFGHHVRWFADVGLPQKNQQPLIDLLQKSIHISEGSAQPPGPVHLNFPFDEPLLGNTVSESNFTLSKQKQNTIKSELPQFNNFNKPLIIAGRLNSETKVDHIIEISEHFNAPIFADALSQLRFNKLHPNIMTGYHHFLKNCDVNPDFVIRFGQKPVSKILNQKLDDWKEVTFLVDTYGHFNDDCPQVIRQTISDFTQNCQKNISFRAEQKWNDYVHSLDLNVRESIQNHNHSFYEGDIADICLHSLQSGDQLIVGNSMPIRDLDMFSNNSQIKIRTFCNRGASGIDGVVSTALGIASTNKNTHSLLLIGDLSFYHDMNGLLFAKRYNVDCTIVVINNNGGGIFSFLPHADLNLKSYPEFWTTSHNINFEPIAKMIDSSYKKVSTSEGLKIALNNVTKRGVEIIEVDVNMEHNVATHHDISDHIQTNLKQVVTSI